MTATTPLGQIITLRGDLTREPLPTRARAETIRAFNALIEVTLATPTSGEWTSFRAAEALAERLHLSGLMALNHDGIAFDLTLCDVTTRCTGHIQATLRAWQQAAERHLAQGVQG